MDERVLQKLSYGLFVCTAKENDKDNGCIINTVTQVAENPIRIAISVNKQNYTHDMILATQQFNVSILSEGATFDTFKHFGFQSGRNVDKIGAVEFKRSANGIVYIEKETNAYISGKVIKSIDLGTHTMFIAEVVDGQVLDETPSATYAYYFAHIKPKPEAPKQKGWVCKICGYVYQGDPLPPDFICPLCKHPASDFEPIQ